MYDVPPHRHPTTALYVVTTILRNLDGYGNLTDRVSVEQFVEIAREHSLLLFPLFSLQQKVRLIHVCICIAPKAAVISREQHELGPTLAQSSLLITPEQRANLPSFIYNKSDSNPHLKPHPYPSMMKVRRKAGGKAFWEKIIRRRGAVPGGSLHELERLKLVRQCSRTNCPGERMLP